jgi:hypothetical protein
MTVRESNRARLFFVVAIAATFLLGATLARSASDDTVSFNVEVTDATSGKPLYQAQLTLQFPQERKLRPDKWYSYSAKTDQHGNCKFVDIPKGPIRLMVIAPSHQTFGKEFQLEKDGQLIEIKLKRPQPVL